MWSEAAWTLFLLQMSDLPCAFVLNQKPMFVPFHLNFCSVLNFWTYMFFLCTLCFCRFALPAMRRPTPLCFAGLAPALLLAAIFIIIIIIIIIILLLFQWESMAALWREHGKMMKFGTLLGMVINSDLTNFGVSKTTSIAPPPVQKFNIEMVITREPLSLEKWNLVHLITLIILITCNSLQ